MKQSSSSHVSQRLPWRLRRFQGFALLLGATLPQLATAGVIDEAQPLSVSLTKMLNFLLLLFGLVAILGMIIAGVLYFTAGGNERQVLVAKQALWASVAGTVVTLGSIVLVWTITKLLA